MNILRFAVIASLSLPIVTSFSITSVAWTPIMFQSNRIGSRNVLQMSEKKDAADDVTFVKSVLKKEIAYDEKSGRFFETNFGEGECVPDEEYCYIDQTSGESIRLTVEEKERIFVDALQVGYVACMFGFFSKSL